MENQAQNSLRVAAIHVVLCLIFLSLPVITSPDFGTFSRMFQIPPFRRSFFEFFLLLAFLYLNFYVLLPKIYYRKRYVWYAAVLLVCYVAIELLPEIVIPWKHRPINGFGLLPRHLNWLGFHLKLVIQFAAVFFLGLLLRTNSRLRDVEQEKLKAEVSYLKAQMNPHFLFNTLNSLYALTIEKSDTAPDAVVKLSGMMRYIVTESSNDYVSLDKELAYLSDYIDLQRLRISDPSRLDFRIDGKPNGKRIAPLMLIPFVENAFKYGVNDEENWAIRIVVAISDTHLIMDVRNNKVTVNVSEEYGASQGIENTRKRLDIQYPGDYDLSIEDTRESFGVKLKLRLT
jgi:hypothetical protein